MFIAVMLILGYFSLVTGSLAAAINQPSISAAGITLFGTALVFAGWVTQAGRLDQLDKNYRQAASLGTYSLVSLIVMFLTRLPWLAPVILLIHLILVNRFLNTDQSGWNQTTILEKVGFLIRMVPLPALLALLLAGFPQLTDIFILITAIGSLWLLWFLKNPDRHLLELNRPQTLTLAVMVVLLALSDKVDFSSWFLLVYCLVWILAHLLVYLSSGLGQDRYLPA